MHYVDFIENAVFRSSGDICWLPLPSPLLHISRPVYLRCWSSNLTSASTIGGYFTKFLILKLLTYSMQYVAILCVNCKRGAKQYHHFNCVTLQFWCCKLMTRSSSCAANLCAVMRMNNWVNLGSNLKRIDLVCHMHVQLDPYSVCHNKAA